MTKEQAKALKEKIDDCTKRQANIKTIGGGDYFHGIIRGVKDTLAVLGMTEEYEKLLSN